MSSPAASPGESRDGRTALVTGSAPRVAEVQALLEAKGWRVLGVTDDGDVADACQQLGTIDCYVQLPVSLSSAGGTLLGLTRQLLTDGLLRRFDAAAAVQPCLSQEATVVLVAGNLPPQVSAPDDASARLALLRVLAHAIRADTAPRHLHVRVVSPGQPASEIAEIADTGRSETRPELVEFELRADTMSYEDWRTEMIGLATLEM